MKILLTGNCGFIGSLLENELKPDYTIDLKQGENILNCALPDADIIVHLAAQADVMTSIADPLADAMTNIIGTIRLAKHYRNKKFIFASSGGYIQEEITAPYGLSKLCAEEYIKLLCSNYVILRFANIFGPGSRSVVDKFINDEIIIYGDGKGYRDYVFVNDLLAVIHASLYWENGVYSLGSGKNYRVKDLAMVAAAHRHKNITFKAARKGELKNSFVPNNTEWKPQVDVIDYIINEIEYAKTKRRNQGNLAQALDK